MRPWCRLRKRARTRSASCARARTERGWRVLLTARPRLRSRVGADPYVWLASQLIRILRLREGRPQLSPPFLAPTAVRTKLFPIAGIVMHLTIAETAALLDMPERWIRRERERGILPGNDLELGDAVYLVVAREFPVGSVSARKALFQRVTAAVGDRRLRIGDLVALDLHRAANEVATRHDVFERWKTERVMTTPDVLGGEPCIAGTRLPVRHVGELVNRGAAAELREDYPELTEDDLRLSAVYARAYPRIGRPRADEAAAR
jgi:uncharacterized protein (DUF433 family)